MIKFPRTSQAVTKLFRPLRGLAFLPTFYPQLTLWATSYRAFHALFGSVVPLSIPSLEFRNSLFRPGLISAGPTGLKVFHCKITNQ
jgi:hypothetical protein